MKDFQYPDDIYTEAETDPNTLANLGPLARLAGVWEGKRGVDINPKAEGPPCRVPVCGVPYRARRGYRPAARFAAPQGR